LGQYEWVDPLANSSHVSNALGDDFNLSWDQVDEAIGASDISEVVIFLGELLVGV
jgi:hypothetical protein